LQVKRLGFLNYNPASTYPWPIECRNDVLRWQLYSKRQRQLERNLRWTFKQDKFQRRESQLYLRKYPNCRSYCHQQPINQWRIYL